MAYTSEDLFGQKSLIDYTLAIEQANSTVLTELFPQSKQDTLTVELFKGAHNSIADMASIHAFGTKALERTSIEAAFDIQDMMLVKERYVLKEKDLIMLEQATGNAIVEKLKEDWYGDIGSMIQAVLNRFEAMRGEILATGKLKINENGFKGTIDYQRPAELLRKMNLDDPDINPLDVLEEFMDVVEEIGNERPTRMLTHPKMLRKFVNHPKVRKAFLGVDYEQLIPLSRVNSILSENDFPTIQTYNKRLKKLQKDGTYTKGQLILPENAWFMLPGHKVGDTFHGPTAEGRRLRKHGIDTSQIGFVTTTYTEETNPPIEAVGAASTGLVSFPHAEQVGVLMNTEE